MRDDLSYWLALQTFHPFGPVRLQKLARRFSSMKLAFEADLTALMEAGIEPHIVQRFLAERTHIDPEKELEKMLKAGVNAITFRDETYPSALKTLYDPPAVLYVRGTLPEPTKLHLAVVGSRTPTAYGKSVITRLIPPLVQAGTVIVSGLAYGIDAAAHDACVDAGGITVAVLGTGVDHDSIYPSANRVLASRILASGGALISEFPVGTKPLKQNFPLRNRIIAGLCTGTIVVEAAPQSGSLITARAALEAGRDVYAVPGPINSPLSEGPNNLLKMGATPLTQPSDIHGMEALLPSATPASYEPKNEQERAVYQALEATPKHIDELVVQTTLSPSTINTQLTLLEMKGVIRHDGGQYYRRA